MRNASKENELFGQFFPVLDAVIANQKSPLIPLHTFIDLFCGIGGFHVAAKKLGLECVFASDIDEEARKAYEHNYGMRPYGDITRIKAKDVPDHDLLCAGFPCQPFSIIGKREGFADPRGTLFFEILRIIKAKKPRAIFLENVRQLATINAGKTLKSIKDSLEKIGYQVDYKILNALDFGLPQKRERIMIVGFLDYPGGFEWPQPIKRRKSLTAILEKKPDSKHFVSDKIKRSRHKLHKSEIKPAIWHENKSGNVSSAAYSCALRAGASYNYLLVDGERRLTPREMLRLQGFPNSFKIVCSDTQTRKQAGNSVAIPMIHAVMENICNVYKKSTAQRK